MKHTKRFPNSISNYARKAAISFFLRQRLVMVGQMALLLALLQTPAAATGTGDGGGGNLCKGKPIESYKVDFSKSEAFEKHLKSMFADNFSSDARPYLNGMLWVLQKKAWYSVPCRLNTLNAAITGLPSESRQAIVHLQKEVFVDRDLFDPMPLNEQALLLIHEALMGLKFLRNEPRLVRCMASEYRLGWEYRRHCENNETFDHSPEFEKWRPTASDHVEIRAATQELFALAPLVERFVKKYEELKPPFVGPEHEENSKLLERIHDAIRATLFKRDFSFDESTVRLSERGLVSRDMNEIRSRIEKALVIGNYPKVAKVKNGFFSGVTGEAESSAPCAIKIEFTEKHWRGSDWIVNITVGASSGKSRKFKLKGGFGGSSYRTLAAPEGDAVFWLDYEPAVYGGPKEAADQKVGSKIPRLAIGFTKTGISEIRLVERIVFSTTDKSMAWDIGHEEGVDSPVFHCAQ